MMWYLINSMLNYVILFLVILVGVAYLTLLERKLLGYIQLRKGPNKVGFMGLLQPFSDGIKLLMNESLFFNQMNLYYYYLSPIILFMISMFLWILYPFYYNLISMNMGVLLFFCILSLNVYPMMIMGWSSNSLYASLGSLRSISQTISYEISLILLIMGLLILIEKLNFNYFFFYQKYMYLFMLSMFLSIMLFVSFLAELNRTPFDLVEGESELVSGFNVEYMSGGFTLIFLGEYSNIIFLMMIFSMMNFGLMNYSIIFYFFWMLCVFKVVWIRGVLPRMRYDSLMYMVWLIFLPVSLNYLIIFFFFKMLYIILLLMYMYMYMYIMI